ncbi:MAG: AAA family ATPase [Planctomycetaceae bacterium]|nr:AAA family ATPase [Planctomycetaceae bacterium]
MSGIYSMLNSLSLKNFTVFSKTTFQFAPGLNVVIGENGAGKTHVLKAAYTVAYVSAWGKRDSGTDTPSKGYLEKSLAKKLRGVFRPDSLGCLISRQSSRVPCKVLVKFKKRAMRLGFSFNSASKTEVAVDPVPRSWEGEPPVYIPTRELLTIFPNFVSLYDTTELPFEEMWRDTCLLLGAPLARGDRLKEIERLLGPLEELLGGKVELADGRFYLKHSSGKLEAPLMAEGLRKIAMIARLIATGALLGSGTLFWDEPEANLNPKVIKLVARTILHLCRSGVQVFIASHSLFLLRELDILLKDKEFKDITSRFFGLHVTESGVSVQQGDSVDEIGQIDALQEELSQSDRYLDTEAE